VFSLYFNVKLEKDEKVEGIGKKSLKKQKGKDTNLSHLAP
jgi:hypothetical protein